MNNIKTLIACRLLLSLIFTCGAIALMYTDKDGWGWCILAALILGSFSLNDTRGQDAT